MNIKHLLTAAAATVVLTVGAGASAANKDRVVVKHHPHHTVVKEHFKGHGRNVVVKERFRGHPRRIVNERFHRRHFVPRVRVINTLRARHIRYYGIPFLYGGMYMVRCYDAFGRLGYCQVNPYTGGYVGFSFRL